MNRRMAPRLDRPGWFALAVLLVLGSATRSTAQPQNPPRSPGLFLTVRDPITSDTIQQVRTAARLVIERHAAEGRRPVIVLEFLPTDGASLPSEFGSSYDLATLISGNLAGALTVAFVPEPLTGYAVLPALACDEVVMGPDASIGPITPDGAQPDPAFREPIRLLASRKGKDPELLLGLLDRDADLRIVRTADNQARHVPADKLAEFRRAHEVLDERPAWEGGRRGVLGADAARERGFAQLVAATRPEVAAAYRIDGTAVSSDPTLGRELVPIWIKVQGPIDEGKRAYLGRRIEQAKRERVNLIFFQIDSPGGLEGAADGAADLIAGLTEIKTVALIDDRALGVAALLPLACHEIVFRQGATMGDVRQVIAGRRNRPQALEDRQVQSLAKRAANLAEQRGHPAAVAIAMIDPASVLAEAKDAKTGGRLFVLQSEIEADPGRYLDPIVLKEAGEVLTVGSARVEGLGFGRVVNSVEDFKALYGLKGKAIRVDGPTWVDSLVTVLTEPFVSWMLLFVGLFMLVIELKLPGIGLPAITSCLAFLLFFWSHYLTGTADQLEIILFLVGMVCLALEVFVFPGFGVFGMSGILLVLASIVLASHSFAWPTQDYEYREMGQTILQVALAMVCVAGGAAVLARYFPSLPLFNKLVLKPERWDATLDLDGDKLPLEGYESLAYLIGEMGRTTTVLRPSGKAKFGDRLLDVTAPGAFIEPGSLVEVVDVQGLRVIVKQADL